MASWFEHVTGLDERAWLRRDRSELLVRGAPVDGDARLGPHLFVCGGAADPCVLWDAGAFRVWSLRELEEGVASMLGGDDGVAGGASRKIATADRDGGAHAAAGGGGSRCESIGSGSGSAAATDAAVFEIRVRSRGSRDASRVEVSQMQAAAGPSSMFQVASNFNCMEFGSVHASADSGDFVTGLMYDSTQGPAAASGTGVAAITRVHAAFYSDGGRDDPRAWGQCAARQVQLLGDAELAPHFPVTNGKLYAGSAAAPPSSSLSWPAADEGAWPPLLSRARVGLHVGAPVHFRRARAAEAAAAPHPRLDGCVLTPAPAPVIDQVFVAAMNVRARGIGALSPAEAHSKMRFLLRAAYEGTFAAAALRRSATLVLTCVGGGVFGNPLEEVAAAMARAHAAWRGRCPALTRIVLPLYDPGADAGVFERALRAVGVAPEVRCVD